MQAFCPRIDMLKGNRCILRIQGAPVRQKLGMILENKVVQKLKLEKNNLNKKLSPELIFLNEYFFWKNSADFWHRKLTLKVQFRHFLTNHNSSQDCFKTISFEHVDFWAKSLHFRTYHKIPQQNWHYILYSILLRKSHQTFMNSETTYFFFWRGPTTPKKRQPPVF